MAKATAITGAVSAVSIAYGAQYPSITVGNQVIKIAPVWYLLDQDFEIKAGDQVSVLAAPSLVPNDSYWYAIEITNTVTKAKVALRDAAGVPLWTGGKGPRDGPNGPAAATGIGCIDPATIATVTGVVDKVSMGVGIQMPALTVKSADGKLISMKIGPERVLLEADFELAAGDKVTAKYALAACSEEFIALALTNAAGVTLTLRNDDGTPAWR